MALRGLFWRMLGGETDDAGQPTLGPDDWVEVFEGWPADGSAFSDALLDEGVDAHVDVFVPARIAYQQEAPQARVLVRAPDAMDARALIAAMPHLGNRSEPVVAEAFAVDAGLDSDLEVAGPVAWGRPEVRVAWLLWGLLVAVLIIVAAVFALVGISAVASGDWPRAVCLPAAGALVGLAVVIARRRLSERDHA